MSQVPESTISVVAEFPEELHRAMTRFLLDHPQWDHDQLISAALSSFLVRQAAELHHGMSSLAPPQLFGPCHQRSRAAA